MSLFKQNIPAPAGGVSQLPPEIRGPGYADDLVNTFPSSPKGFGVRQGTTQLLGNLQALDSASVHTVELQPSDDERYLAVFDKNGVRVINLISGALAPLTVAGSASTFLSAGSFTSAGVDDTLYVAARGYSKAELSGDPVAPQQNGALVTVVSGRPSAIYKVTLDGISVSVRTPDDPPPQVKRPAVGLTVNSNNTTAPIGISLFADNVTMEPAQVRSVPVDFTRSNYSGIITLAVLGVSSSDISVALGSTSITGSGTTATITTSSTASAGTYTVTLSASGTGVVTENTTLTVTVVPVGSGPGGGTSPTAHFGVTETEAVLTVRAGTSIGAVWSLVRFGGFSADISPATVSAPSYVTSMNTAKTGTPDTQILTTFSTSPSTPEGSYTFMLRFYAPGSADVFREITLNVTSTTDPGDYVWNDTNNTSVSVSSGSPIGSIPLFITRFGSFTADIDITQVSFDGPEVITLSPLTLTGSDDHVTVSWDFTGVAGGTYHLHLKATSGSDEVPTTLIIYFAG